MGIQPPGPVYTDANYGGRDPLPASHKPVLLITTVLFWASLYSYSPILAPYLTELGTSLTLIGMVIGSYGLTQAILRLPAGILSDRLRNKRAFIITGMALSLISGSGLFLFRQVGLILLFRATAGIAATMWVHFTALYLSYHPAGEAARAMGQMSFANSVGMLIAVLAGSILAQMLGWRSAFLLAALLAAAGLLVSLSIHEKRPVADSATRPPGLREVLQLGQDRLLFWSSVLGLLCQLLDYATVQGFVPQYASALGASKAQIGQLAAFAIVPRGLAALLAGNLLARRFKPRVLIALGATLVGAVACLLPFMHSVPLLFLGQLFSGLGNGLQISLLLALCTQTVAPDRKVSAMGFFQAAYAVGMVIGPTLLGYLADLFGLQTGFVVVGLISMASAVLALIVLANQPGRRTVATHSSGK